MLEKTPVLFNKLVYAIEIPQGLRHATGDA